MDSILNQAVKLYTGYEAKVYDMRASIRMLSGDELVSLEQ